jgi:hypothetical protein
MRLIGLNGFKGSGKDTTFLSIAKQVNGYRRVGFADKLKIMACKALGYTEMTDVECIQAMDVFKASGWLQVTIPTGQELPASMAGAGWHTRELSGRQYLQHFGNQARKVFGDTFWIDQVLPDPQRYHDEDKSDRLYELLMHRYPDVDVLVVTDVRYPNEAERVQDFGGEVWNIVRPEAKSDGHDSEQPLPSHLIDRVVLNTGDLDQLDEHVRLALAQ